MVEADNPQTSGPVLAPMALRRLTTSYVEAEDRIRIAGELTSGETVTLWLTQRLALRLVPPLLNWLAPDASRQHAAQHQWAQERAREALQQQAAVPAGQPVQRSLITAVDFTFGHASVQMVFKGPGLATPVRLTMQPLPLRQWLSVLKAQFVQAGWPAEIWPVWMSTAEPHATSKASQDVLLH